MEVNKTFRTLLTFLEEVGQSMITFLLDDYLKGTASIAFCAPVICKPIAYRLECTGNPFDLSKLAAFLTSL